ncbi:DeoR/GlpR family transcriptional regulator of sugar metabolism [Variovorax sp. TBS-050B]|uniref:DeoR/GlpR family DNA-binding transcription regulator n=1 Tax=Variovorax sp. TBS-050B TaxID=2940551 RepID=UPI0024760884|nr:DeoR/GlpR family DNA-binding transcription regulator [Variovorax sp. TBS-050B]MDH6591858.1 DeoR/GlpR family transcriptional regulator of sugar metabolism [Variovorax sp. TBS-050B]
MLTSQRKQHILSVLRRDGNVVARSLSEELALSEDTIRRDLRELAAEGLLRRVHGGALPLAPAEADYAGRMQLATAEKVAIGRAAAALVRPGQVVLIDGGTTAVQMARHLGADLRATVVTHSPSVAVELVDHAGIEVVLIGGRLFRHSMVAVGAAAMEAISRIRADICFLGVTGVHAEAGLTTGDAEEAAIKRALMAAAAETVVLASSEKIGAASAWVINPLPAAARLLVSPEAPAAALAPLRKAGLAILRSDGA